MLQLYFKFITRTQIRFYHYRHRLLYSLLSFVYYTSLLSTSLKQYAFNESMKSIQSKDKTNNVFHGFIWHRNIMQRVSNTIQTRSDPISHQNGSCMRLTAMQSNHHYPIFMACIFVAINQSSIMNDENTFVSRSSNFHTIGFLSWVSCWFNSRFDHIELKWSSDYSLEISILWCARLNSLTLIKLNSIFMLCGTTRLSLNWYCYFWRRICFWNVFILQVIPNRNFLVI